MRLGFRRHRIAENITWNKHVVAAGWLTWDAGSIPAASTILRSEPTSGGSERRMVPSVASLWERRRAVLTMGSVLRMAGQVFGNRVPSIRLRSKHWSIVKWCAREDLNLQSLRNQILSLACLPFHHARIVFYQRITEILSVAIFPLSPVFVSSNY